MKNLIIREKAKSCGVYLWEIARKLEINDGNFSRKLREELSEEEAQKIMDMIEVIAKSKESM